MADIKKIKQLNIIYLIAAFWLLLLLHSYWQANKQVKEIPFSEFQGFLQEKKISEITISESTLTGKIASSKEQYVRANRVDLDLAKILDKHGVQYSHETEYTLFKEVLSWLLPFLFLMLIMGFVFKRISSKGGAQGGFMSVGKSKAKIYVESDTKTTFKDVAGADEAKAELKELVEFLKTPQKYKNIGGRMPKGIILVGPPGTGKTLIARAIAGEAGVPFFSTNGAEFVEMFVGVGAARVRDLFEQAKKKSPCIIFIDELDALGKVRMGGAMHGNDEKEQTLNQLLVELDGFDSRSGIILLAATNRPEILDPALLRSGRFDRQVLIDKPDKEGRTEILRLHAKNTKLDDTVDLEKIGSLTVGFTGADLENLVNEASLFAVRKNREVVINSDFTEALERIIAGLEKKNRLINAFEREVVAHHEMGHAIVARFLNQSEAIHKVSIIPRGIGSLGYTIQRPTEDRYLMTKDELNNKMAVLLGGRSAEKIIFNHLSTGASDDLDKATDIAWNLATKYGMDEKLGHVVYDKSKVTFLGTDVQQPSSRLYSDETAREIDFAVRKSVQAASEKAEAVLKQNIEILKSSAKILLEQESLTEEELKPFFDKMKWDELT